MSIIKEMREVCQQRRPNANGKMVWAGHWFNRLFVRHFSIYITWLFVKMGISANGVTFLIIPTVLIGVALCVPHVLWINIAGAFFVMLAEVFDCVDGEIARWTKKSSLKGVYLDLVSHVLCNAPLSLMCGLHLYMITGKLLYLILAFIAYATVQVRLGLRDVYWATLWESSSKGTSGESPVYFSGSPQPGSKIGLIGMVKFLLHKFTDEMVIRLLSFAGIFLSYAGFTVPLIFLSWFFVVFGIVVIIGDFVNKYVFLVPKMKHVKKV